MEPLDRTPRPRPPARRRAATALGAVALVIGLWAPTAFAAGTLSADDAESIVRAQWFEGVPEDRIAPLDAAAVARLEAILLDPEDREAHAPALELLGRAGGPGALDVVLAYAATAPSGEVDGAARRARFAVPIALGYLARHDDRALAALTTAAAGRSARAQWSSGRLDARRIARLETKMTIAGLGISGRPEARAVLAGLAAAPGAGAGKASADDFGPQVAEALRVNARVARQEAER